MAIELEALADNGTWEIVDAPPRGTNIVSSKWALKLKLDSAGEIERLARLVARGFSQKYGVDFSEIFAPVIKMSSVRLFFVLSGLLRLALKHGDVPNAYVKERLAETIYMHAPKELGIECDKVLKLLKPLYGLKQSGRCWNEAIDEFVVSMGFQKSRLDPCIYIKVEVDGIQLLGLYVDDVLFAAANERELTRTAEPLHYRIQIKILGQVKRFLGMDVIETDRYFQLNQSQMIRSTLERFNLSHVNPVITPMDSSNQYNCTESEFIAEPKLFREALGSLLWIANATRPDVAFATNFVSRFREHPKQCHWELVKKIFRYLKGTTHHGLVYKKYDTAFSSDKLNISIWSDADWAGDRVDRKSASGSMLAFNGQLVSWASRKQLVVALSTMEAELIAGAYSVSELGWIRQLMQELFKVKPQPTLLVDNRSAILNMTNEISTQQSKHIAIRYYFIKVEIKKGHVKVQWCKSAHQLADILTKPLTSTIHLRL